MRVPWQDENGAYYGLPYAGVIQGVYYNKDIFNKLQLSPARYMGGIFRYRGNIKKCRLHPNRATDLRKTKRVTCS